MSDICGLQDVGLLLWPGCDLSPEKSMLNLIHNDMELGSGGSSRRCLGHQRPSFSGVGLVTSRAPVTSEAVCCVNLLIPFFHHEMCTDGALVILI